ncbi:MAG: NAD+ synthase [Bacteroidales bacterium]|nr:NAD+ synthase [Bacteroidales bacterium]
MKITCAQLNYIIGDFEGNSQKIISAITDARNRGSDLVVFSELALCGYPPLDLLEHKYFIERSQKYIEKIIPACTGIAAIIGAPVVNTGSRGKNLFNSAYFIREGRIEHIVNKTLLPTYDIFDEYRYFEPNTEFGVIEYQGHKIALTICEDLWYEQPILTGFGKDKLYNVSPMENLVSLGPDLAINIAASPFSYTHDAVKREILAANAKKYHLPVIYVNQVGAHTELIFDGGSSVIDSSGNMVAKMALFSEEIRDIDTGSIFQSGKVGRSDLSPNITESIHDALVLGIRDYFVKTNFSRAVVGLSGGIDSAVTVVLAVKALGKENVRALLMPSKYSSEHSVSDAVSLAGNLGIRHDIIPIEGIVGQFDKALEPLFKGLEPGLAEENIQARVRGNLLMALSNKFGSILLNTSNKSEAAVGYGTLYGDMSGGLSVLGDVYKTDVYKLADFMNRHTEVIPVNTITKPPSAELKPDQRDTDSLPGYDILDKILFSYIELKRSAEEIIGTGLDEQLVHRVITMVNNNEYKRFQTPPVLRISSKAFGIGRRMPLAARY